MSGSLERRQFFKLASLLTGGVAALAEALPGQALAAVADTGQGKAPLTGETALHWLEGTPASFGGATFGVPWPQGRVPGNAAFELRAAAASVGSGGAGKTAAAISGPVKAVQSWPLAYWPDGTLKWSAHALPPDAGGAKAEAGYTLHPLISTDAAAASSGAALARNNAGGIEIDTGVLQCSLPRSGAVMVGAMKRSGKPLLRDGRLVLLVDGSIDDETAGAARRSYDGAIDKVTLEQNGPLRAVVRVEGSHRHADGATLLPFVVRLYFYKNSDTVRLVHTLGVRCRPRQGIPARRRTALRHTAGRRPA